MHAQNIKINARPYPDIGMQHVQAITPYRLLTQNYEDRMLKMNDVH